MRKSSEIVECQLKNVEEKSYRIITGKELLLPFQLLSAFSTFKCRRFPQVVCAFSLDTVLAATRETTHRPMASETTLDRSHDLNISKCLIY